MSYQKTKKQCFKEYQSNAKERRRLAILLLDGRLTEDDFQERWQWYDVKGEAIMLQRQREEAKKKAQQEYERKHRNELQKDLFRNV